MTKKLSASSRREKLIKRKGGTISYITRKTKKELTNLYKLHDQDIDYSDIPPLDFSALGKPLIGKFYKPTKKQISIRLDADVLDWFKHATDKYQSLINGICRRYMENCQMKRMPKRRHKYEK